MSKKNKSLKKERIIEHSRDTVVSFINLPKCDCGQIGFATILREDKTARIVCQSCLGNISKYNNIRYAKSVDNTIPLQNNKRNSDDKSLFKTTSTITPKGGAKWSKFSGKKEKINEKSPLKILLSIAWQMGDKTEYYLWGDPHKVLVEWGDFYIFEQTGKPVGKLDSHGNLSVIYD